LIDAGCGSGILAFSASALGFGDVSGFDIDPEAIVVCHKNATENPHITSPNFMTADLEKGLNNQQADVVIANIQADVLVVFSQWLIASVRPSGTLILSGLLTKEVQAVREHYEAGFTQLNPQASLVEVNSREDGEWSDLRFMLS